MVEESSFRMDRPKAAILCVLIFCSLVLVAVPVSGDTSKEIAITMGSGGSTWAWVHADYGDLVHVEWLTNRSIYHELTYWTDIVNGGQYGGPVDIGHAVHGNMSFYSKINGTYTLTFTNVAPSYVHIHALISVTSDSPIIHVVWLAFSAALLALAVALLLFSNTRSKKSERGKAA